MEISSEQLEICKKFGATPFQTPFYLKVGISIKESNSIPFIIHGLRHPPEGNTSGWYIWMGSDYSEDTNFFEPLHIYHLKENFPFLLKYLALPPGYRFLIGDNDYEDVWFDENLLDI